MNRQDGFSMIELMIALVLGLLVGGMVLQVFVMNNRSIVFQRASIITQDQGRVALDMMTRYIRMAGYQEFDLSRGSLDHGLTGSNSGAADSIAVRYQAGNAMSSVLYDCLGNQLSNASSGSESVNEFKLVNQNSDGLYTLACYNGTGSGAIASNVEQLNILYGVDTGDDLAPNLYVNATSAIASGSMDSVVAVKVCIIIASGDNMVGGSTPSYTDCEGNSVTPTDQRIRRKASTTITLRNRTGGSA
jgi:type IV pilus assembly protein PilW